MDEMVVVYAGETPPERWQASVFLAGPMPRDPNLPSWRPDALAQLHTRWAGPGTLVVFVPEARDRHHPDPAYLSQLWEERWMAVVDVIVFWVPRDMSTMPGLNTNIEFGRNESGGRVVLGLPPTAVSVHYLRRAAETHGVPVLTALDDTAQAAIDRIGEGADRQGPERDVPLLIWRTEAFQTWRSKTTDELYSARLLWAWSPRPAFALLAWAIQVRLLRDGSPVEELMIADSASSQLIVSPLPSDLQTTP